MPRKSRRKGSSGIYHIMIRGINRQTIFEEEEDKFKFLEVLSKYKGKSNYQIFSYCLMDNHVHLLMKESEEESISESIKRISSSYVYWYNWKYARCGHLFQERYKSEAVDTDSYFMTVLRYIHQNPLKAGLARTVFESKWTSLHEYLHKTSLVDIDYALSMFSPNRKKAIELFIQYMQEKNDDKCLDDWRKTMITDKEVRDQMRKLGVENMSALQQMEREDRDEVLAALKQLEGVSIRQISRVTGFSKSVVHRAEDRGTGSLSQ
ncbi:REP element-mobilizing transposase RayT [Bacillus ectoiniformans]|uniref:transposase n=1 Tax=Bacillus ectoiniformans TaxID=1494429 RepID=UPI00195DA5A4|nr:transposase [Bacillus ectoiniformans]MBM7648416.1 REP element-mobilizing transposase RayT [Bacillus ectoiniformans]